MASAQMAGLWRLYRVAPSGHKTQIGQYRIEQTAPAGGASEGSGAAVSTPEKLIKVQSPVVLTTDDTLQITYQVDTGATIGTITKTIWSVPTVTEAGSSMLGRAQFANPAPTAIALVAGYETLIGGYKVVERKLQDWGSLFLDLQNNG